MVYNRKKSILLSISVLGIVGLLAYLAIEPTIHFLMPKNMEVVSISYFDNVILNFKFVTLFIVLAVLIFMCSTYLSKKTIMATTNAVVVLVIAALIGLSISLLVIKNSMSSLYVLFEGISQQYEHSSATSRSGFPIERIPLTGIVFVVVVFFTVKIFVSVHAKKNLISNAKMRFFKTKNQ